MLGLWGRVLVAGEGLQGWLLREAAKSFPGSRSDQPLVKAKPISAGGSTSVITYLRSGKRLLKNLQQREEWDVRETTMQTPRSVKEREEVHRSRDSPAARGGLHARAGGWAQRRP